MDATYAEVGTEVVIFHRPEQYIMDARRHAMMSLYKTTIVIWSEINPNAERPLSLTDIAQEADGGEFYCSKCESKMVDEPTKDPYWDGTEFFGEDEEEEDIDCPDCQGTGIGNPHMETGCPVCRGTGVKKREQEEP